MCENISGIAVCSFNRPAAKNALSRSVVNEVGKKALGKTSSICKLKYSTIKISTNLHDLEIMMSISHCGQLDSSICCKFRSALKFFSVLICFV